MLAPLATAQVVVRPGIGCSEVHRARAAGPLRLLTPRAAGRAAWVVTSSLGGGLVDGDNVACEIEIHPGATCVITTQASTKAYRGVSSQQLRVRAFGDATALVVPDPVVPYRDASAPAFGRRATSEHGLGRGTLGVLATCGLKLLGWIPLRSRRYLRPRPRPSACSTSGRSSSTSSGAQTSRIAAIGWPSGMSSRSRDSVTAPYFG